MADTPAEPGRRLKIHWGRVAAVVLTLALLAIAGLAGLKYTPYAFGADNTRQNDFDQVQTVARRVMWNFYSISYTTFDNDSQRFYRDMTDKFKATSVQQLGATLRKSVMDTQLVSKPTAVSSGVVNIDGNTAQVVVVITRSAQAKQVKTPQISKAGGKVDLTRVNGRWLVSNIGALQ